MQLAYQGSLLSADNARLKQLLGPLTIESCWQELIKHHRDGLDQLFVPALPVWAQQEALDEVLGEVHSTTHEGRTGRQEYPR